MFHVCGVDVGWFSGVIESLFLGAKGGGADLRLRGGGGGGQEDGITMIFSHHIYYAQSKVKWGVGGGAMFFIFIAIQHFIEKRHCYEMQCCTFGNKLRNWIS